MKPYRYAQDTSVSVSRSRDEIENILRKHGATGFAYGNAAGKALVAFEMRDRRIRFVVPMPALNKSGSNQKEVDRETRRRYRALLLVLKAKLEAVASEIVVFDAEFLAFIVVEGNTTVGDRFVPQLPAAIKSATMPNLLGDGST